MKDKVTKIIESFEKGTITEPEALTKLQELTGRTIDRDWLRNYWRGESTEHFVDRLCAQPIADCDSLTDADALALLTEYLHADSPGRRHSIEAALERRYGKPGGTVSDFVSTRGLSEPSKILDELKQDTRIYL